MNEFERLTMRCTDESLIPSGPGYNNLDNQVCTLPGSRAGATEVSGTDYVKTGFSYDPKDLWRNFGIIVVLIVTFLFTNVVLGEIVKYGAGGRTITFYTKENKERKVLNEKLQERKHRRQTKARCRRQLRAT